MLFSLTAEVARFTAEEGQSLTLTLDDEHSVSVLLFVDGILDRTGIACRTTGEWPLDFAAVSRLTSEPIAPSIFAQRANLRYLPAEVRDMLHSIEKELWEASMRVIDLLRWRFGLLGELEALWSTSFSIVHQGEHWLLWEGRSVPLGGFVYLLGATAAGFPEEEEMMAGTLSPPLATLSPEVEEELGQFIRSGSTEPLGHSLFREAWKQRLENPRSALVIGVAAAEVGYKQFVAEVAPDAALRLENPPSRPLVELLGKHFPRLMQNRSERTVNQFPKVEIITPIEKAVESRNTVVHKSPAAVQRHAKLQKWITDDGLQTALLAISDLLWLLDYHRGYEWALEHVRVDTRAAWEHRRR